MGRMPVARQTLTPPRARQNNDATQHTQIHAAASALSLPHGIIPWIAKVCCGIATPKRKCRRAAGGGGGGGVWLMPARASPA